MNLRYLLWEAAVEKHCGSTDEKLVTFFTEEIIDRWPARAGELRTSARGRSRQTGKRVASWNPPRHVAGTCIARIVTNPRFRRVPSALC